MVSDVECRERFDMNTLRRYCMPVLTVVACVSSWRFPRVQRQRSSLQPFFTRASTSSKAPDADGYLQRWLLLDPITIPIRSNQQLTDSFVQAALKKEYFPASSPGFRSDGDTVTVGGKELVWHALDTSDYNVNLYHFAHTGASRRSTRSTGP